MKTMLKKNERIGTAGLGALGVLAWLAMPVLATGCGSAIDVASSGDEITDGTTNSGDDATDDSTDDSSDDSTDDSSDSDGVSADDSENYVLQLSAPELQSTYVKSDSYDSSNLSATLKCDDDAYVTKIGVEYSEWGTHKSITYIEVECTDLDGDVETRTAGVRINAYGFLNEFTCSNPGWTGTGFGTYIPGIKVLSDNYVKNLQVKCASAEVSSSESYAFNQTYTVEMTSSDPYYWSWIYPDGIGDDEDTRNCGENEILSGLKIRYAHDEGGFLDTEEAAITKVEFYCSTLSAKSTETSIGGILQPGIVSPGTLLGQ